LNRANSGACAAAGEAFERHDGRSVVKHLIQALRAAATAISDIAWEHHTASVDLAAIVGTGGYVVSESASVVAIRIADNALRNRAGAGLTAKVINSRRPDDNGSDIRGVA
jgi:hypothetical protein